MKRLQSAGVWLLGTSDAGVEVQNFLRFEVGEGIEVEELDFAAEVAAQLADSK